MRQAGRWLTLVLSLAAASGASAQSDPQSQTAFPVPRLFIGYVANAPDQLLGAGAAWLPSFLGGWGLYLDAKQDAESPGDESDFLRDRTAEEAAASGDERRVTRNSYRNVNLAVVRAFRPDVVLYLGGGISDESVYSEFFDPDQELGNFGHYWVEHADSGGLRPNLLGGIFFRLARNVTAQFGAEAVPSGFTVGVHLTF